MTKYINLRMFDLMPGQKIDVELDPNCMQPLIFTEEHIKEVVKLMRRRAYWQGHGAGYGWTCKHCKAYRRQYRMLYKSDPNGWWVLATPSCRHVKPYTG